MKAIEVQRGDITKIKADAIVNAANSSLLGGGGVDGAIHAAGGPEILKECKAIVTRQGGCKTGQAVITTAGRLSAKFVIHTVGPIWHGGKENEARDLANSYTNSLKLAAENDCNSVAFPNISTGVYGYPKKEAARIAVESVSAFLSQNERPERVIFVCFDQENEELVREELRQGKNI